MVEVGSGYVGGNTEVFEITDSAESAHYKVFKLLNIENAATPETQTGKITETRMSKNSDHRKRLHPGGIKHCNDRTGTDTGNGIGLKTRFFYGHKGAGMCKAAGSSSAESDTKLIGLVSRLRCSERCRCCVVCCLHTEGVALFKCKISQKK